tara:strand:+ start:481 stop:639 length:159 start_codon:yes stop_codon:yes gene_type:complete
MKEWRWSLYTRHYAPQGKDYHQETGSGKDIRTVMNDVANTVEYLNELKHKDV